MRNDATLALSEFFKICVRKRPLNTHEIREGLHDAIDVNKSEGYVTLHDGRMARNGRRLSMTHRHYFFDRIWDETASNHQVCMTEVNQLVQWALDGYSSTLLCFGQTGTGKTYTLSAALEFVVQRLAHQPYEVSFFEIHGKKCYDLLSNRRVIHLRSDASDNVHVRGAKTLSSALLSTNDLFEEIQRAMDLRSSEVTERNPISSRSHAICTIKLSGGGRGKLMLVDLAGSERNFDTLQMSANQHRESADINSSLLALKDCFRAYQAMFLQGMKKAGGANSLENCNANAAITRSGRDNRPQSDNPRYRQMYTTGMSNVNKSYRPPYRASLLTRILKECFSIDQLHRTVIIATVSPTAVDMPHSINTLQHVLLMSPRLLDASTLVLEEVNVPKRGHAPLNIPVSQWTYEQLISWLSYAENGRFAQIVLPVGIDGAQLMKLNNVGLSALFENQLRTARQEEEGSAWVESTINRRANALGNSLWAALRKEQETINRETQQN